jgi:hypothetical protein
VRQAGSGFCYYLSMTANTQKLLEAFEHLPPDEKRSFTAEVLRRSLPFDSGPISNEEIGAASSALFESLQREDADPKAR